MKKISMKEKKLELDIIVDVLSKIKEDDFYFRSYSKDIIKSYINQEIKQMYSEEEVKNLLNKRMLSVGIFSSEKATDIWFKQYTKTI